MYSFNAEDGSSTEFSVKRTLGPITSSPVIADIDNDGKIDIICTSEDHFVYSWEGDNCENGRVEWGEFHRDNYNSGDYIKGAENLVCTGVNESNVSLSWDDKSDLEDGYYIYREIDGTSFLIGFVQGDSFVDNDVVNGKTAKYFIQAIKGEYPSKLSNEISIYVPYCNRPTITSLTFQDSIVKITWNDNSRKNKDYYVGKKVRGVVAGSGKDTLVWYHFGHVNDSLCFFIDTFPIEGENIYRVAAIDSTNYYWYSDYDTIDIPFYKADSFRAVSLPDTSILFRWRDRTYLESAYSLRKDSLTGYMGSVPPDSCAFLYSDADLGMHRYYLVSWQKRDGVYFYWRVCDSLDYQWHVDNEPPVLSVYGGGTQKRGFFQWKQSL